MVFGIALGAALALAPAAQAKPKGDSIVGSGTAGNGDFSINAVETKNGIASGAFSTHLAIGNFSGPVTFVNVSGTEGCAARTITESTDPNVSGFIFHVRDDAPDAIRVELLDFTPPSCEPSLISPAAVTTGDVTVTDNFRP